MSGADTNFIPGEYELSPSDAYETILTKLTTDMSDIKKPLILHLLKNKYI